MQKHWTVDEIDDLENKVIIVTGANAGLGFEAAKVFAGKKATVILACRSTARAENARKNILEAYPEGHIDIIQLDLGDLDSIKRFVNDFKAKYSRLDILLNNAGIIMTPFKLTKDGFESQNGVNHLGHFALTRLLFDLLKKTTGSRIVNVSSNAHKMSKMDFSNYMFEKGDYGKLKSYASSKLSNLLFTYELDRKIRNTNLDIKVLAAHPGVANTKLGRHMKSGGILKPIYWIFNKVTSSAYEGALPQIRACLDKDALSGEYYGPVKVKGKMPMAIPSSEASHSLEDAKTLWDISEKLTKIKFEI